MITSIGIDPGWASCGIALQQDGKLLSKTHFVPRDVTKNDNLDGAVTYAYEAGKMLGAEPKQVFIERYVAYKGIHSDMSERILMYIGALKYEYERRNIAVHMVRAIDWKPKICKFLVRTKEFNNPYPSFDKKFSILAAEVLSGQKFKTDHEADAVCLSYLSVVEDYNLKRT
jgi:hypothetical protein